MKRGVGRPKGTAREWVKMQLLLDPAVEAELKAVALEEDRSVNATIRTAVAEYLARREE